LYRRFTRLKKRYKRKQKGGAVFNTLLLKKKRRKKSSFFIEKKEAKKKNFYSFFAQKRGFLLFKSSTFSYSEKRNQRKIPPQKKIRSRDAPYIFRNAYNKSKATGFRIKNARFPVKTRIKKDSFINYQKKKKAKRKKILFFLKSD